MAHRMIVPDTAFRASRRTQRRDVVRSEDHRAFIRSLPCVVTGTYDAVQAAHVSYPDLRYGKLGRGFGNKESDCWIVPLSAEQHTLQHSMNEHDFWHLAKIDPCRIGAALYICTGDRDTALLVLQHAKEP